MSGFSLVCSVEKALDKEDRLKLNLKLLGILMEPRSGCMISFLHLWILKGGGALKMALCNPD